MNQIVNGYNTCLTLKTWLAGNNFNGGCCTTTAASAGKYKGEESGFFPTDLIIKYCVLIGVNKNLMVEVNLQLPLKKWI